jgi:O-antigen/teichoic acid export membrane protein
VKRYYQRARALATSATAKDTYVLFVGNLFTAFLAFLFTVIVARGISISDFGVFSAINNLVLIIAAVSDIGISAGLVNFIANFESKGESGSARKYLKASLVIRLAILTFTALALLIFPKFVSETFLASSDATLSYWVILLSFGLLFWSFFPIALQAYRRFSASVVVDASLGLTRTIVVLLLLIFLGLTLGKILAAFVIGTVIASMVGFKFIGASFVREKVPRKIYSNLLKYSGWIGVNKVLSTVSGRLDVQMIAVFAGATATGLYSISSRLALFIVVLASSYGAVLAPRLASFEDKTKEKRYILKATLALIPITVGIIAWIIIAKPFIVILFGQKYLPAVGIFRALAFAMIPFLFTVPSVTAIVYAIKKTIYIGTFSIFQLIAILLLNLFLIPKYGPYGPTITFGIVHTILAVYTWLIVIRHYWIKK